MNILFFLCLTLFAVTHYKVYQWTILSILGNNIDTPLLFKTNPGTYHRISKILLIISLLLSFFIDNGNSWIQGLIIVITVWSFSSFFSKKHAFSIQRKGIEELLNDAETEIEKKKYSDVLADTSNKNLDRQLKEKIALYRLLK